MSVYGWSKLQAAMTSAEFGELPSMRSNSIYLLARIQFLNRLIFALLASFYRYKR